ncbi:four-carbon acid sugar kinase family protein [Metabacillus arenae]|uniref:Four-carbon acid sugar kinase family protein n=1 Tax=Metabacillus arenae TaxID=2771434 RepID=A0A926RZB5_9BACI|nr:four-carbon acid sugar kinase family protein [Metabacillus arenae]MBD1382640.1 four-carbon acid sugar kinase family protein [Metabacillus arenae]
MRFAVIADDLTGASDCSGQLIQFGLHVSVMIKPSSGLIQERDVLVFNSDSRSLSGSGAYQKVRDICDKIKGLPIDILYKKIDSTMRGNIGQELNAIKDVFQPDFVFIAPAYPQMGRQVIDGIHYLNHTQIHETEFSTDPKTPVTESYIPKLIQCQSNQKTGLLSYRDLRKGITHVSDRLVGFKKENISYIVVDSIEDSDLELFTQMVSQMKYSVIWTGSACLMNYLPKAYGLESVNPEWSISKSNTPVFLVIGSVSKVGRKQLSHLLLSKEAIGVELQSSAVIQDEMTKQKEIERLKKEIKEAFLANRNVAFFSCGNVKETHEAGEKYGLNQVEISNEISRILGQTAAQVIKECKVHHLFLTGGDTAYQVMDQLGVNEFQVINEIEPGIPIGKLSNYEDMYAVTKAGNFGTVEVLSKAVHLLQGRINT